MKGETRTGKGGKREKQTYKADTADVQHERHHGVQKQTPQTRVVQIRNMEGAELNEQRNDEVHRCTDGGKVVQTNERVHLLAVALEQDLDHDEPHGLEHDSAELEEETGEREGDLAEAGKSDTKDDEKNVNQPRLRRLLDAPGPGGQQDGYGRGGLEHLDEGDAEVEVHHVAADETAAEEKADGDDGAQVEAARHLDVLAAIEEGGCPGENLGGDGREDEMPTCQDSSCEVSWSVGFSL